MTNYYKMGLAISEPFRSTKLAPYHQGLQVGGSGIAGTGVFANVPDELDRMAGEMAAFQREMSQEISKGNSKLGEFYIAQWVPFWDAFSSFYDKHQHWYNNLFLSSWHDTNEYRERFIAIVEASKKLFTPALTPTPVRQDAFQQAGGTISNAIGEVFGLVKIVVIVGIIGVVVFFIMSRMG